MRMAVALVSKTIRFSLDVRSINKAIKELESYMKKLKQIEQKICEGLAEIGLEEASVRFSSAQYDGDNDVSVKLEQTEKGYNVVANGKAVAFIEFGTGVTHNRGVNYPLKKPSGIVGIGEYGKKQGRRKEWRYKGNPGTNGVIRKDPKTGIEWVITKGNPAQMPMYKALTKMQSEAERVVREAFRSA